jgi:PAS domain S-box-containing protein
MTANDLPDEKKLHAWMENVADIITILDKDGTILYQSPAIQRILGWEPQERIGQNVFYMDLLVHPEDRQKKQHFFIEVFQSSGETIISIFRMRHKDGSYRFIEASGRNLLGDPDIGSLIATYRDVTEREELEMRKDEFIGMASHELKTPVTSLKVFAQVLKMELEAHGIRETAQDLVEMERQIEVLDRLIGDLLDVSRIRAGKLDYYQERFALDPFVQRVVATLQRISQHHAIILIGESGKSVAGDQDRLEQVLINLVSNAIRYAPAATPIEVQITARHDEVILSVQDYGPGIPEAYQQKIFERFYRPPQSDGQKAPGLGIGLYIANEIVQRHGGRLWVESRESEGARFSFSLPILNSEEIEASS